MNSADVQLLFCCLYSKHTIRISQVDFCSITNHVFHEGFIAEEQSNKIALLALRFPGFLLTAPAQFLPLQAFLLLFPHWVSK